MTDSIEVKMLENDAKTTLVAVEPVTKDFLHTLIDEAKGDLSKGWEWLKAEIEKLYETNR